MKLTDEWWTAPAEAEDGRLVMVTGRDDLEEVMASGKYVYRVEVVWRYEASRDGMPGREDARLMEEVDEALKLTFKKNKIAVMTGIYTGAGERDWVFYTSDLKIFSQVFNRALSALPTIPIVIEAESDPDWQEYREMRETTYITPGE